MVNVQWLMYALTDLPADCSLRRQAGLLFFRRVGGKCQTRRRLGRCNISFKLLTQMVHYSLVYIVLLYFTII